MQPKISPFRLHLATEDNAHLIPSVITLRHDHCQRQARHIRLHGDAVVCYGCQRRTEWVDLCVWRPPRPALVWPGRGG